MIPKKYFEKIRKVVEIDANPDHQWFIFGSSLRKKHFGDVDLGVIGKIDHETLSEIREAFENSTLPYKVDIVPFSKVQKRFRDNVFNSPIKWIRR